MLEELLEELLDLLGELLELDLLEELLLELHQLLNLRIQTSLHLAPLPLKFITKLGTLAAFGSSRSYHQLEDFRNTGQALLKPHHHLPEQHLVLLEGDLLVLQECDLQEDRL